MAVVAFGVFLISQGLLQTAGANPTPSAEAAASSEASPEGTPSSSEAANTPDPSTVLIGVFPGPDAKIPPDAPPVIPDLRVEELAAAAEAQGMSCESLAGVYDEGGEGYTLACEGQDKAGHAKLGLTVTYWTLDGVSEIYFSVWPDQPGAVVSPSTPIKMMSAISTLSSGDVAKTWVLGHLDDQACSKACIQTEGRVLLEVQSGENGGRAVHVTASAG